MNDDCGEVLDCESFLGGGLLLSLWGENGSVRFGHIFL
jgi:hypothetical protein